MFISVNWIKEFLNKDMPNISSRELMSKLTLATCEVEEMIETGKILEEVTVVEISSIKKHPDSDRLNLVTFKLDESGEKTKEVVCGAPNVKVGLKVPYAKIGTTFSSGLTLTPKKIRGIVSEGMLCSSQELDLPDTDYDGLLELPKDAPTGSTLAKFFNITTDLLFE